MNTETAKFRSLGFHEPLLPWHMGAHNHPFHHEVIVGTAGAQRVSIRGQEIRAEAGDILFYPSGVTHEEWADAGQKFASYFFSFVWPDCPKDIPLIVNDRLGRIRLLLDWLRAEIRTPSAITPVVSQALFQAVLGQFLRLWLHPDDELVDKVRGHVREHIVEPVDLDGLSHLAGMSKYHFVRKYRELTGRTPMEDVRALRIERAREMLLTSNQPIKHISEAVGISNVYHMSRLFKKLIGVSPGSLRRRPGKLHPSIRRVKTPRIGRGFRSPKPCFA
jgi:AraC-like DNA-binding protein